MPKLNPIVIAGGGLAGLTLGLHLRRWDIPVTVHEAGAYPRHRVCGEFLNGRAREVLASLGVDDLLDGARRQRTTTWYLRDRPIYRADLPDPAWSLSRFALDEGLRRKFCAIGGVVRERSRLPESAAEGHVWCAGRRPGPGPWVGLKCHVSGLPLDADLEMHLAGNGYVGLTRVEDGRVNVCGLFRRDPAQRTLIDHLRRGGLTGLADRIGAAGVSPGSSAAVAGFVLGWQGRQDGMATVGDACGMIPPFTGNGMSMACEAASEAAEPLADYARGAMSWVAACRAVRQRQRSRFGARLCWARLFHPFLTHGPGQAVLAAVARWRLVPFSMAFQLLR